jgi:hypothetical protein
MQAPSLAVRIDWFRVLTDLCSDGGSLYKLAAVTSIPRTSLQSYKNGVEPTHAVGMCLLAHWSAKMGRPGAEAPITARYHPITVR